MKSIIFILFSLIVIEQNQSMAQPMPAIPPKARPNSWTQPKYPPEAWLALTCRGVITPMSVWPPQFQDVVKFYIQVAPNKPRPSLKELSTQAAFMPKFEQMTKYCTDQRLKLVKPNVEPGYTFLDWGSEYGYSRFVEGEVFFPESNACRLVGQPCAKVTQCCGHANPIRTRTTCDTNTNSCIKLLQISEPREQEVSTSR
jgi:hypothetical protein